jgi:hypothetical protein
LDYTIQAKLLLLSFTTNTNQTAQFSNDIRNNSTASGVDNSLSSSWQSIDLSSRTPSGTHRCHFLDRGDVLTASASLSLSQIGEADGGGAVADASSVGGGAGEVFGQEREEVVRASEVCGYNRQQSPSSLTRFGRFGFVAGCLLHQLAIDLVS